MRKLSCCIVLALMLSMTGAAFAQTMPMTVPCGDLSEADCAILTDAQTASASLDSVMFALSLNVEVTDIPNMSEPVAFALTGSGAFSGLAGLQSGMMDMSDMTAMQEDPGQHIADMLGSLDGDLNLTLSFPPELVAEAGAGMPDSISLQVRLVDGFGYLNLDTLQPLLGNGGGSSGMSGWFGIDLAGLIQAAFEQMPADMFSDSMMPNDAMMEYMDTFNDPEFLADFITVTRTDDGSGDTAVFEYVFDFGSFMSNPAFQEMMRAQMEAQMEQMGETMDEEEIGEALAMSSQMFKGMTMTMTQEIGLEDGYLHSINGTLSFDTAGMMEAMEDMSETSSMDSSPVVNVDFSIDYSSFNSVPEITAPEDATVIPYQSLLGMGAMAGMGDMPAMEMTPTSTPAS